MKYLVFVDQAASTQGVADGYAWRIECDGSVVISGWTAGARTHVRRAAMLVKGRLERSAKRAATARGWHLPEHQVHLGGGVA